LIQPQPGGGLTYANATLDSIYGRIESKWKLTDDIFQLTITIPPNSEAIVKLPTQAGANITEQGLPLDEVEGVAEMRRDGQNTAVILGSGHYVFTVKKG